MIKNIQTIALTLAATVAMASPSFAEDTMKKYGDSYTGDKGEQVEVAYFEGKEEAIIVVKGVNNKWDGKAIKTTIEPAGTGKDYVTKVDGEDYHMMVVRDETSAEINLPGYDANPIHVSHSGIEQVQPLHLLTQYKEENKTE